MPKFEDVKIAEKMNDVVYDVEVAADEFVRALRSAHRNYADIPAQMRSLAETFPEQDVSDGIEHIIEYPDLKLDEARAELKNFDKALLKLFALRLQLGEVTDIRLIQSVTNSKEWARLMEYSL